MNKLARHTPHPSAARTASGATEPFQIPESVDELILFLDVTAVSGTTPNLTVTYEYSPDGTRWFTHSALPAKTASGRDSLRLTQVGSYGRLSYAITGTTPSFTFQVDVEGKRRG